MHNEKTLLENRSGQIKYIRTMLDDLQTIQSKLVDVIPKIQDHGKESKKDLDEASEGEEELPVSESNPTLVEPSNIQMEIGIPDMGVQKGHLNVELEEQLRHMKERHHGGLPFTP